VRGSGTPKKEEEMTVAEKTHLTRRDSTRAFNAFLAGLHSEGLEEMVVTDGDDLHRAFGAALQILASDERTAEAFSRFRASPQSGVVGEFDDALMRASKYKLVHFPNASYTRVGISMTPFDAADFLRGVGSADEVIREAARSFKETYLKVSW
jgi:hypothetical protein